MTVMRPLRVVIVDNHQELRRTLVRSLHSLNEFDVVGETGSPMRGVELAAARRPDVILFDAPTPGLYGAELCSQLVRASPDSRVVVFTSFLDPETEDAYRRAGADSCLVKDLKVHSLAGELLKLAGATGAATRGNGKS
jgi:DNA-binding NarL/FixJ family response regulator